MKILFFLLFLTSYAFAEIKQVKILGNKRVSSNTIESFVDKKSLNIDSIYINNLTRKIYNTDFFSDIKISYDQDILTISVTENPIINFFYIIDTFGICVKSFNFINYFILNFWQFNIKFIFKFFYIHTHILWSFYF